MTPSPMVPSVAPAKSQASVPVIVDDPKLGGGFDMTRCVYFQIDCEDTLDEWTMNLGSGEIAFRMIGLSGVIEQPFDGSLTFQNPWQVEDLFSMVQKVPADSETDSVMHVELEEIWLPNKLLNAEGREVFRGAVYRIGYDLFRLAFGFTVGRFTQDEFLGRARNLRQVEFSEQETNTISLWARNEIETAGKSAPGSKLYLPPKREEKEK